MLFTCHLCVCAFKMYMLFFLPPSLDGFVPAGCSPSSSRSSPSADNACQSYPQQSSAMMRRRSQPQLLRHRFRRSTRDPVAARPNDHCVKKRRSNEKRWWNMLFWMEKASERNPSKASKTQTKKKKKERMKPDAKNVVAIELFISSSWWLSQMNYR